MDTVLQKLGELISDNFLFGIVIAFVAGILTVFTPCSLSSIPLIVAYVGGTGLKKSLPDEIIEEEEGSAEVCEPEKNSEECEVDGREYSDSGASLKLQGRKALIYSVFICIGQSIVFVALGLIAASLGRLMGIGGYGKIWNGILIVLMVWMVLEMFGITSLLSRGTGAVSKVTHRGIIGALLVGMVGALFSTPCSTPILTAMLAYVSTSGSGIWTGGIMLLSYSLGHSILLVVAGTSIGFVEAMTGEGRLSKVADAAKIILGLLILGLAVYLLINTFFV